MKITISNKTNYTSHPLLREQEESIIIIDITMEAVIIVDVTDV